MKQGPLGYGFSDLEWACISKMISAPTLSFRETYVQELAKEFAKMWGLFLTKDRVGNLVVTNRSKVAEKSVAQILAKSDYIISAHMDHPGFLVSHVNPNSKQAILSLFGGVHRGQFSGASIKTWNGKRWVRGKVKQTAAAGSSAEVVYRKSLEIPIKGFEAEFTDSIEIGFIGTFDQPGCRLKKDVIATKSADNLINCALGLIHLKDMKSNSKRVALVLTRAEEVGFIGLLSMVKQKLVPKNVPWVVLEASQAKAPVQLGQGVVIRVGDKASAFHSWMDLWLQKAASLVAEREKSFCFQRALLTGGTCEATVLNYQNALVGGLALPLGNYHNVGKKKPAPEMIHLNDCRSMRQLLWGLKDIDRPALIARKNWNQLLKRLTPRLTELRT